MVIHQFARLELMQVIELHSYPSREDFGGLNKYQTTTTTTSFNDPQNPMHQSISICILQKKKKVSKMKINP